MEVRHDHWKLTAIGMGLVIVTALVTGLVVASWRGPDTRRVNDSPATSPATSAPAAMKLADTAPAPGVAAAPAPAEPAKPAAPVRHASSTPPQSVVTACNQYAANHASAPQTTKDKTIDVVKDAAVGAVGGAAVGAVGGAIAGGGKGAGKGAAIGGAVGAGGGTLYGIYTNRQHDQAYRDAYAGCMRSRGYTT